MSAPNEPLTQLQQAAAQLHELYLAYVHVGFTAPQALYLVGCVLSGVLGGSAQP